MSKKIVLFQFIKHFLIKIIETVLIILVGIGKLIILSVKLLLGWCYGLYIKIKENFRLKCFETEKGLNNTKIILEILRFSTKILFFLIISVVLFSYLDLIFWKFIPNIKTYEVITNKFTLPDRTFIETVLGIFIGAISAVLGIIFAIYTIGVQTANEKYSEKVSDFINHENVSDYFFGFLIFTGLFSLITLIKTRIIIVLPVISFLAALVFVSLALLGILIFKNHYINSLKPQNLFRSLWSLIFEKIKLVTEPKSYKYKSWSLAIHSRNSTNRYLDTFMDLFRDLIRNKNWNSASYAPMILGNILRDYLEVKKFINKEKGWWFFETYKQIKADDLTMFPIKANYELQGKGVLHMPTVSEDWLEDKIISFFKEFSSLLSSDQSDTLVIETSSGYKNFLVGDYKKRIGKPPLLIPGAIQLQEFKIFKRGLIDFLALWRLIDFNKPSVATAFLNDYFVVVEGLLEAWDVDNALKIADSFYCKEKLNKNNQFLFKKELPIFTRSVLKNYWEKLEVEQTVEGKIITPKEKLLDEIRSVLNGKRKEIISSELEIIFNTSGEIIKKLYEDKNYEYAGQFIKMQYEWVSRFLHIGDAEIAETLATKIKKFNSYVLYLPKSVILDLEFLEQAEKGYFMSLIKKSKQLFKMYSDLATLILIMLRDQETDQEKLLRLSRLPIIWGGITFVFSELEQDHYYVETLSSHLEKIFKPGYMIKILETMVDLKISRNIWWETTRYNYWYSIMFDRLRTLRRVSVNEGGMFLSFREKYEHPSEFIQNLAMWDFLTEEKCIEGFIEWLKENESKQRLILIKEIIRSLNILKNNKNA